MHEADAANAHAVFRPRDDGTEKKGLIVKHAARTNNGISLLMAKAVQYARQDTKTRWIIPLVEGTPNARQCQGT